MSGRYTGHGAPVVVPASPLDLRSRRGRYHGVVRALVVANAPWRWNRTQAARVLAAELVVAADGAPTTWRASVCGRRGGRDLDSITAPVRRFVGEDALVLRAEQDHSDLHKTFAYCFDERGATALTVMAATGGRLDHAVENMGLLARWSRRGDVAFLTGDERIVAVADRVCARTRPGDTVSLMPLGRCEEVRTRGLAWELPGRTLDLAAFTSLSNRAIGTEVEVAVSGGVVLLFLPDHGGDC